MLKYEAIAKVIIKCNFSAENFEHAKKIASDEIWNSFDEVDVQNLELTEIDTVISVDNLWIENSI